eukprot:m.307812 g.307812  ORF g.307812 m.307812 type:complete len:84 (-) comp23025_c1_seq13:1896-2147(-)
MGAPVMLAKKIDGSEPRMCIDFTRLNQDTEDMPMTMSTPQEVFDSLYGSRVYTKIDATSGYHQVRVAEDTIPKLGMVTPGGRE